MSKVVLMPLPPEEIREGLYSVIGGALASGAPAPSWVAVDDSTDAWVVEISGRAAAERTRSVVAVGGDKALVTAQRLGVGGAMWLPPSSLGALEAFAAADAADLPVTPDAATLKLLEGSATFQVVTFADRSFWRAQLGDDALTRLLAGLASALGVPVSILAWPALVVADRDAAEIVARWQEVAPVAEVIGLDLSVLPAQAGEAETGVLDAAYRALLNAAPTRGPSVSRQPVPVHELPHGRRVGWWCLDEEQAPEEDGWFVTPVEVTPSRCQWRLDGAERSGIVAEVLTGEEVAELDGVAAARIPGWASRGLRPGSPAGLLAIRIAEAAARRGLPLWIPGVDEEALRLVLGLPGVIWVDGPAVPD